MSAPFVVATIALAVLALVLWQRQLALRREAYIRSFELPRGLFERLRRQRPELSAKDCQLIAHALRQFFLSHLKSGRRYVSMPSQVVDELWHEFILYTRHYEAFCRHAFGRFLHHTPAAVLGDSRQSNAGLRRCFWWACRDENINPRQPSRLPLLFAIDGKLEIADGFRYVANCKALRAAGPDESRARAVYCGGDFGDAGFDGGTDGFGDAGDGSDAGGGDGDGGSSGCGGGGCGGGGGE